jgi:hypothetical protein
MKKIIEDKYLLKRYERAVMLVPYRFSRDYKKLMEQYPHAIKIEVTKYLEEIIALKLYQPETLEQRLPDMEMALAEKIGNKITPLLEMGYYPYLDDSTILTKGVFAEEQLMEVPFEYRSLAGDDARFVRICILGKLNIERMALYKQSETTFTKNATGHLAENEHTDITINGNKPGGMTRSKQLLAIYLLLKGEGIDHHINTPASAVVRLVHLFSNIPETAIQNSDIYKKYRVMPHYKKGKELMADLNFIRPFFEAVNLKSVLQLIDEELEGLKKRK